jgi:hypothetical protein
MADFLSGSYGFVLMVIPEAYDGTLHYPKW